MHREGLSWRGRREEEVHLRQRRDGLVATRIHTRILNQASAVTTAAVRSSSLLLALRASMQSCCAQRRRRRCHRGLQHICARERKLDACAIAPDQVWLRCKNPVPFTSKAGHHVMLLIDLPQPHFDGLKPAADCFYVNSLAYAAMHLDDNLAHWHALEERDEAVKLATLAVDFKQRHLMKTRKVGPAIWVKVFRN